ncbi:hypothetical protein DRF65_14125 [Chryseobacterium pennae]|uniref:Peptidase C14 caspase domain-containing protein n=1 Tax=Chryseobacterium pennae TaxID=2258962 RepID=A0A3D9C7K4_9FLAO|nr:caspase family protein [Chryseobacterium pennae]REC61865.1 hypothetical protein DRF65_14125 [Chryseobacterium pennae]
MPKNIHDFAVVVGVSHYKILQKLDGPERDANLFLEWLKDENGGNLPEENCYLLLSHIDNTKPIQDMIDDCFEEILEQVLVTPGRRLYFFFSGHGIGVEWDATALILPKWTEVRRDYALSGKGYQNRLMKYGAFQQIFFFLDCCRNTRPSVQGADPQFNPIANLLNTRRSPSYIYSATEFGNKAYEADNLQGNATLPDDTKTQGLFTSSLLKGLKGAAEIDGNITTKSLSDYLSREVPPLALEKANVIQKPHFIPSHTDIETVILDNIAPKIIELKIFFMTDGLNIVLKTPEAEIIRHVSSSTEPWILNVKKGLYIIYNEEDVTTLKPIQIDGILNIVHHEY